MERAVYPSDISREQFAPIRTLLEGARRKTRPRRHDLYDVFCAVLYLRATQGPLRSLPRDFPPWRTVHEYLCQWKAPRAGGSLLEQALALVGSARPLGDPPYATARAA